MLQIDKYIENGVVMTGMIANDVRYGRLSHQDILDVLNDARVKKAFIGTQLEGKKNRTEWGEQYLDELFGMASMTCFNEDYLLFLEDVAKYVEKKRKVKRRAIYIIVALVAASGICLIAKGCSHAADESAKIIKTAVQRSFKFKPFMTVDVKAQIEIKLSKNS